MARFHGMVGYGTSMEDPPDSGIWREQVSEFPYSGEIIRNTAKIQAGDGLNSDISVNNSISIVADEHAIGHSQLIKYVRWEGAYWSVTSVEVKRPRLILSLGGVYNGPKA